MRGAEGLLARVPKARHPRRRAAQPRSWSRRRYTIDLSTVPQRTWIKLSRAPLPLFTPDPSSSAPAGGEPTRGLGNGTTVFAGSLLHRGRVAGVLGVVSTCSDPPTAGSCSGGWCPVPLCPSTGGFYPAGSVSIPTIPRHEHPMSRRCGSNHPGSAGGLGATMQSTFCRIRRKMGGGCVCVSKRVLLIPGYFTEASSQSQRAPRRAWGHGYSRGHARQAWAPGKQGKVGV
jgi:hypothetical protein